MAAATDIHVQLMKWENRSFQQALMERAVSQDEALRRLTEMVEENGRKLDAIIEHLKRAVQAARGLHQGMSPGKSASMIHFACSAMTLQPIASAHEAHCVFSKRSTFRPNSSRSACRSASYSGPGIHYALTAVNFDTPSSVSRK